MSELKIHTVEMHTGGQAIRIVTSGLPEICGDTILEKMSYLKENVDHLRKMLMAEPRGHFDMFGVYIVKADIPGAEIGCIFIHNEGYGIMCGDGVIALGRYVIDNGLVKTPSSPETKVLMQCPCGPVEVFVQYNAGRTGDVRYHSVPSFLYQKDLHVDVPGFGKVTVDICYGGAFYAIVPARDLGVDIEKSSAHEMMIAAGTVTEIMRRTLVISHPESPDLAFVYGTILTDGNEDDSNLPMANVCVYADRQLAKSGGPMLKRVDRCFKRVFDVDRLQYGEMEVDRSPCGSGVTSRVARMFNRGLLDIGQSRKFRGLTGAIFSAKPVKEVKFGPYDAIIVEVSGRGYYSGTSTFTIEPDDEIGKGFLVK